MARGPSAAGNGVARNPSYRISLFVRSVVDQSHQVHQHKKHFPAADPTVEPAGQREAPRPPTPLVRRVLATRNPHPAPGPAHQGKPKNPGPPARSLTIGATSQR